MSRKVEEVDLTNDTPQSFTFLHPNSDFTPPKPRAGSHPQRSCMVQWNDFGGHTSRFFSELYYSHDISKDVTLVCNEEFIKAHKFVLSAASAFFRKSFEDPYCTHPVVVIKGISPKIMRSILAFIYLGKVIIPGREVDQFKFSLQYLNIQSGQQRHTKSFN